MASRSDLWVQCPTTTVVREIVALIQPLLIAERREPTNRRLTGLALGAGAGPFVSASVRGWHKDGQVANTVARTGQAATGRDAARADDVAYVIDRGPAGAADLCARMLIISETIDDESAPPLSPMFWASVAAPIWCSIVPWS